MDTSIAQPMRMVPLERPLHLIAPGKTVTREERCALLKILRSGN